MPIPYDACASRVPISEELEEEIMLTNDDNVLSPEELFQPHSLEWAKNNLYGAWGRQIIPSRVAQAVIVNGRAQSAYFAEYIEFWFEDVKDALHFKMRWF